MRITQGTFSFLPELDDVQVTAQVEYCLRNDRAVGVEYTDHPHPRNTYWEMWGNPMSDLRDVKGVMMAIDECRKAHPDSYIRIDAFDFTRGFETVRLSFLVNRPKVEPRLLIGGPTFAAARRASPGTPASEASGRRGPPDVAALQPRETP